MTSIQFEQRTVDELKRTVVLKVLTHVAPSHFGATSVGAVDWAQIAQFTMSIQFFENHNFFAMLAFDLAKLASACVLKLQTTRKHLRKRSVWTTDNATITRIVIMQHTV
jgi:hypothetical protein